MALHGDLVDNAAVGDYRAHPKPLRLSAAAAPRLHGDLVDNSEVGAPRPEPISIVLPDGTDLASWYATVKAYIAAHP